MDLKTYITDSPRGAGAKLAADLGISASYLSQMANGDAPVSPQRAVEIEQKTLGKVTRQELRDDWKAIWPELTTRNSSRKSSKRTN